MFLGGVHPRNVYAARVGARAVGIWPLERCMVTKGPALHRFGSIRINATDQLYRILIGDREHRGFEEISQKH